MRYLPLSQNDREEMFASIGITSAKELYRAVSDDVKLKRPLDLPDHQGEMEVEAALVAMAGKNHPARKGPFFLGAGCYYHHIPATVDHLIQRSEFLTAYTPYQPEVSQGTLTAIFEFQSYIAALTGMDVANASMYDGPTSVAEAALMAIRIKKRSKVHIDSALDPQYKEVLETYLMNRGEIVVDQDPTDETACVIVQTPDFHGTPRPLDEVRQACDDAGALLVVAISEIVSLGMLPAPVQADIVAGEAQSIGVPMSFGGPFLGFFACKQAYLRQIPGRLVGETVDTEGRRSFVLTLNTREQHIRREKATSNICTNQGLCALAFTIHMSLLGEHGIQTLARINHEKACELADALAKVNGVAIENDHFFNEFVVTLPKPANDVVAQLAEQKIIAGLPLDGNRLLVAATEMTTTEKIEQFVNALEEVL